jgi:hypothetical protein
VIGDQERGGLLDRHVAGHREAELVERPRLLREPAVAEDEPRHRHHALPDARRGPLPRFEHDSRELLARREWPLRRECVGAATHEHVGQPEAARLDAHAQHARRRRAERDLAERERRPRFARADHLPRAH